MAPQYGLNSDIISMLEKFRHYSDILGHIHSERAYRRAMASIRALPYAISDDPDRFSDDKIPGVGDKIRARVLEFVETGRSKELATMGRDRKIKAYEVFSKIVGVGPSTIEAWTATGIFTLADLRRAIKNNKITLNHMQSQGLKYYRDLSQRVPRPEVTSIAAIMRRRMTKCCHDVELHSVVAGSYRRGAESSGDIDILVSAAHYDSTFLSRFHDAIMKDPNFVVTLSAGEQRLTFLYRGSSGIVRQIDILYMPPESYHAAILYFTGSAEFNEFMRGRLKARGYRLNQNGLYKIVGDQLQLVPVSDEREIFALADMKYITPKNR